MATDRLAELMLGDEPAAQSLSVSRTSSSGGDPGGCADVASANEDAGVERALETIKTNTAMLKALQLRSLTWVGSHGQGAALKRQIQELGDSTKTLSMGAAHSLKGHDAALSAEAQENPGITSHSTYKIRRNKQALLSKKFVERMQAFQDVQTQHKLKQEQTIRRQFKLVNPNATEEQLTAYLASESGHSVFEDLILSSTSGQQARAALTEVQEKHREIQRLEQSIRELHNLFVDVSMLVESQGEVLDQIEVSVANAAEYAADGVDELRKANRYAAKARKRMCCLVLVLLLLVSSTVTKTVCELWPTPTDEQLASGETASPAPDGCSGVLVVAAFITGNAQLLLLAAVAFCLCCGAKGCSKRSERQTGVAVAVPFTPARHYKTAVRAMQPRRSKTRRSGGGSRAGEVSSPFSGGGDREPNQSSGDSGGNTPMLIPGDRNGVAATGA